MIPTHAPASAHHLKRNFPGHLEVSRLTLPVLLRLEPLLLLCRFGVEYNHAGC